MISCKQLGVSVAYQAHISVVLCVMYNELCGGYNNEDTVSCTRNRDVPICRDSETKTQGATQEQ